MLPSSYSGLLLVPQDKPVRKQLFQCIKPRQRGHQLKSDYKVQSTLKSEKPKDMNIKKLRMGEVGYFHQQKHEPIEKSVSVLFFFGEHLRETLIIKKNSIERQMLDILDDTNTCKRIDKYLTSTLQNKITT